jgi:hypothetical protein
MRHYPEDRHNCHLAGHGLAPGKDLAVSPPLFYPYRGAGPSTLGLGPPSAFALGRLCSHLSHYCGGPLARTFANFARRKRDYTIEHPARCGAAPPLAQRSILYFLAPETKLAGVRTFLTVR